MDVGEQEVADVVERGALTQATANGIVLLLLTVAWTLLWRRTGTDRQGLAGAATVMLTS